MAWWSILVNAVLAYPNFTSSDTGSQKKELIRSQTRAAGTQVPFNELLKNSIKGKTPIKWDEVTEKAFEKCKDQITRATLLVHPEPGAELSLVCDASDYCIGVAQQQRVGDLWKTLGLFSRKLNQAECKYNAPQTADILIPSENSTSPRQFRHLDFISQFTTDIRHISGQDNIVADAPSRIDEITSPAVNFEALAASQERDEELRSYLENGNTDLDTGRILIPGSTTAGSLQRNSWAVTSWSQIVSTANEETCQEAKITRHVSSAISIFQMPSRRFEHVHVNLVVMPYSQGYRYCLTYVDRFSRWPEAIPLPDREGETIRADNSNLDSSVASIILWEPCTCRQRPTTQLPTVWSHTHGHLKTAIKCLQPDRWAEALQTVLAEYSFCVKGGSTIDYSRDGLRRTITIARRTPVEGTRHGDSKIFVFKDLATATHVFVRHDSPKTPLQMPYDGP
ncbi:uncharacterized protein LOC143193654 [Rhynchophorus ferrugineus]|uniref:uncharacterized protein LOC143193654 n=1 Tax=Rhynchophorus ferrugineus TaxID=354439 RepID=UPI003FCC9247